MFLLVGVGKEWAGPVFLHPDDHLLKVDALSCRGGERMGQPSYSPPLKSKDCLHIHDRMGQPSFSPPPKKQSCLHIHDG